MRRILLTLTLSILLLSGRAEPQGLGQGPIPAPPGNGVRELRLGVICYGGISLAIYMFGTTRELHNLLLASDALELDAHASPPVLPGEQGGKLSASARHYYDLLSRKWLQDGVRTRVVVDIISGNSAGGINGIILAKAIATNRPIDDLRKLWFEEADIVRLAGGRPWTLKALGRLLLKKPALTGDRWLQQLYQAFKTMDERLPSSPSATLLPRGTRLNLLVASTDFYGSPRVVEVGDPPTSNDQYHNQVFHFEYPGQQCDQDVFAGRIANATLAFAARSSASFPVAFPPMNIEGLRKALPEVPLDDVALARQVFSHQLADRGNCGKDGEAVRDCAQELAKGLFLIDGGVLDNYPLNLAFQQAGRTTPSVPGQRIFLYLEPDPSEPPVEGAEINGAPNSWRTFWGASASIPSNEPIAEDFRQLARHNERVDRILDLLASNEARARAEGKGFGTKLKEEETVAGLVEKVLPYKLDDEELPSSMKQEGSSLPEAPLDRQAVTLQRQRLEENAANASSAVEEEAYIRLRVHSVLDQLARDLASDVCQLPEDYIGPRVSLARTIVFQWAAASGLIKPSEPQERDYRKKFLTAWDLGYLRRNLRFVLAWIDGQYPGGAPDYWYGLTVAQVEEAHDAVTRAIAEVSALVRGDRLTSLAGDGDLDRLYGALCVRPDPNILISEQAASVISKNRELIDGFVSRLTPKLLQEQDRIRGELFEQFITQTAKWYKDDLKKEPNKEARRAVLARYLGFPYWDRVAYPYTAFSGTGELLHAHVKRLSPRDADSLSGKGVGAKRLAGSSLFHFGAFIKRPGRENDYLWGRFDGADRLSKLLGEVSVPTSVFSAILDEEQTMISPPVVTHLRACVANPRTPVCGEPAK